MKSLEVHSFKSVALSLPFWLIQTESLSLYFFKKEGSQHHPLNLPRCAETLDIRHCINTYDASLTLSLAACGMSGCNPAVMTVVTRPCAPPPRGELSITPECRSSGVRRPVCEPQVSDLKYCFLFRSVYFDIICHLTRGRKKDREPSSTRVFLCAWPCAEAAFPRPVPPSPLRENARNPAPRPPPRPQTPCFPPAPTQGRALGLIHSPHVQEKEGNFM